MMKDIQCENKKIRIAMLGHKRIPSREGGIEVVVEELSCRMVERGYSVTCYNRSGHHVSGSEFDEQASKNYKGVRLKKVFTINRRGLAAMTSSVFAALRAAFGNYNIVHFHAEGPCAMLWLPKLFGKRCIATIHGLDHQRAKWGRFAKAYIMLGEKVAVKFADEIIVLSNSAKKYFMQKYGRETKLIPNGVNAPEIKEADLIKQMYGIDKDTYFLFLGRIVPEKGLHYLIEAFKQVKTNKKLVIAGGSSDTDTFMKNLKKLEENDERILFTGFVQGAILNELYSNAYVYILPSDLEGMPLSLLEAMSFGNCCLTSDISECVDIVEDKAVFFKKGDISDLVEKLQMMCDNPDMVKSLKKGASEYICSKYNWNEVVDMTLKLYLQSD